MSDGPGSGLIDGNMVVFPETLSPYIAAVLFETVLYGVYTVLFCICIFVLLRRKKTLHVFLLVSAVVMFALATADMIFTMYLVFRRLLGTGLAFKHLYPKYIMYVTTKPPSFDIAFQLYRCYMVWSCDKYIIIGPGFLLVGGTICGYIFEGTSAAFSQLSWIYLSMTFAFNVIVTALSAGRIWWISHKAHAILGNNIMKKYRTTMAIIIESGLIYSFYVVLDLAFQHHKLANVILDAGLIQIVGITPTLIIVQVGLGHATQDVETTINTVMRSASFNAGVASPPWSPDEDRHDHRRGQVAGGFGVHGRPEELQPLTRGALKDGGHRRSESRGIY